MKASRSLRAAIALPASLALAAAAGCSSTPTDNANTGSDAGFVSAGRCEFALGAAAQPACSIYTGEAWTPDDAAADCAKRKGQFAASGDCPTTGLLASCGEGRITPHEVQTVISGSDPRGCVLAQRGCFIYHGGVFSPAAACAGAFPDDAAHSPFPVFTPPTKSCVAPRAGEPAGQGADGKVCTWSTISASTEAGRNFADYGDCEAVLTQRPYFVVPPHAAPAAPDVRLSDPKYASELGWVKAQIQASACVCCHSTGFAPRGTSQWYLEAPGNFMDSFYDTGLALGAGWVDSKAFGAYDPADDNGFDRIHSGFPSTDPARMVAFFKDELAHRGKSQSDFASALPFGGPLVDQLTFRPGPCKSGDGIDATGKLTWSGGPARYAYVLEATAQNPTGPPNLDLPQGALWRVDAPYDGAPFRSGLAWGVAPPGTVQRFPLANAPPAALSVGQQYYLYVAADVGAPITRCLFTR